MGGTGGTGRIVRMIRIFPMVTFGVAILLSAMPLAAGQPAKVFILAGQSNMEGAGKVEGDPNRNEGKGSLSYLAENDPKYKHLRKGSGWVERDDVSIWYLGRKGKLAPGFGARGSTIGPELGFDHLHPEDREFVKAQATRDR